MACWPELLSDNFPSNATDATLSHSLNYSFVVGDDDVLAKLSVLIKLLADVNVKCDIITRISGNIT